MEVGKQFSSFDELKNFISTYERDNFVQLHISDSHKLCSAKNASSKIQNAKKELVYFKMQYSCIHGGKKFSSKSTNQRQTRTFRRDCPFKTRLGLTFNGEALRITSFVGEHNHTVSKDVFKCLPRQRVLSEEKQTPVLDDPNSSVSITPIPSNNHGRHALHNAD
ncbi:hypothetical protein M8J75_002433 [Diaphorina citri]|nr:hypothetical protein M8J75_002433 [Diaphorina citri]